MANPKGSSSIRNLMYSGKHALLPPKSPFPSVSPAYADFVPNTAVGPKSIQKPRDSVSHLQRTSSENLLIEEQLSWLDDLLNEPETPVRKAGHRRSSSDSFAYIDTTHASHIGYTDQDEYRYKNLVSLPSWASEDYSHKRNVLPIPFYGEVNSVKQKHRAWDSSLNSGMHPAVVPSGRENGAPQNSGSSSCSPQDADGAATTLNEKQDAVESSTQDSKPSSGKKDGLHLKPSEADTKRAKQQFAQRSRVRKLQYIAELERNVQALQAEGSEASAQFEFLNQQNLILSMENKALKHRLESLAQEQRIKYLEHEMLEREIARLRALYQQQQQPQLPSSSHRRASSRDLDSKFANLSLKSKDANSGRDPVTGAPCI